MDRKSEDQGNQLQLWTLVLEIARFLLELGRLLLQAAKPTTFQNGGSWLHGIDRMVGT